MNDLRQLMKPVNARVKWKSVSHVQLFATSWTITVHGILQARILESVAFSFSRRSSQARSPTLQADFLPAEPQGKLEREGGARVGIYNSSMIFVILFWEGLPYLPFAFVTLWCSMFLLVVLNVNRQLNEIRLQLSRVGRGPPWWLSRKESAFLFLPGSKIVYILPWFINIMPGVTTLWSKPKYESTSHFLWSASTYIKTFFFVFFNICCKVTLKDRKMALKLLRQETQSLFSASSLLNPLPLIDAKLNHCKQRISM